MECHVWAISKLVPHTITWYERTTYRLEDIMWAWKVWIEGLIGHHVHTSEVSEGEVEVRRIRIALDT